MPTSKKQKPAITDQLQRFRDMAKEVGADESPGALERAFGKLDPKKQPKPSKAPKRP